MSSANLKSVDTHENRPRLSRYEIVFLVCVVVCGLGLRAARPHAFAIEHFDEGVYASNIWFGEADDFRFPNRHLYAPPLVPFLLEWSIILSGSTSMGTMSVGILFGVGTIVLVWWVARKWFGAEAGIAAAALATFSDFHILYSRTALTDVPLCFWILLAVYCSWKAFVTFRLRWVLLAGTATGLGWWTKYNGWLPMAISLSAIVPWLLVHRRNLPRRYSAKKSLSVWLEISLVAVVVWSPVWFGLQSYGGYKVVSDNHSQYLVGLNGWFNSLCRQWANHRFLDGWLSVAAPGIAILFATSLALILNRRHFTWNARRGIAVFFTLAIGMMAVYAAGASFLGSSLCLGLVAIAGFSLPLWKAWGEQAQSPELDPESEIGSEKMLAYWILAAWFFGLLVATPFYHPYPRLTLPWLVAIWLGASAAITDSIRRTARLLKERRADDEEPQKPRLGLAVVIVLVSVSISAWILFRSADRLSSKGIPGWQDRTGLRVVALNINETVLRKIEEGSKGDDESKSNRPSLLNVYGEPALVFQLSALNNGKADQGYAVLPIGNLSILPSSNLGPNSRYPTFLVIGPQGHREPGLKSQLDALQTNGRLELISEYHFRPSRLVLLNHSHPRALSETGSSRETISLYYVK